MNTMLKTTSRPVAAALLVSAMALSGCATKGFVRNEVGVVDTKLQATDQQVASQGTELQTQGGKIAEVDQTSREALERATAAGKLAEGKFVYSVALTDDSIKFPANSATLTPESQTRLMELADRLKADNRNVYLEIQGHIDAGERNTMLGRQRAEAVQRFLNKQGVALNRMATISYGKDQPINPGRTRVARAENRRVTVVVLS
jgi:outer membrane protein OmpA-like peptidoglycan-associated protein